jgi:hypothetical protein
MHAQIPRIAYCIVLIAIAVNFVLAFRQGDHIVWSGLCLAIAAIAFIASEWLQLRHAREIETIEHAERELMDELDVDRCGSGGEAWR